MAKVDHKIINKIHIIVHQKNTNFSIKNQVFNFQKMKKKFNYLDLFPNCYTYLRHSDACLFIFSISFGKYIIVYVSNAERK